MTSRNLSGGSNTQRSRITNGSAMLPGVDGRSAVARRFRDIVKSLEAEQPKPITTALQLQIRTAASMQVHVEDLTARMARGEQVSAEEMTRAANGATRALTALRTKATPRRAAGAAHAYLASRPSKVAA